MDNKEDFPLLIEEAFLKDTTALFQKRIDFAKKNRGLGEMVVCWRLYSLNPINKCKRIWY